MPTEPKAAAVKETIKNQAKKNEKIAIMPLDSPAIGTRSKRMDPASPAMSTRSKRRLSL